MHNFDPSSYLDLLAVQNNFINNTTKDYMCISSILGKTKGSKTSFKGKMEVPNLSEENDPSELEVCIASTNRNAQLHTVIPPTTAPFQSTSPLTISLRMSSTVLKPCFRTGGGAFIRSIRYMACWLVQLYLRVYLLSQAD